jgi:hypothetical protein
MKKIFPGLTVNRKLLRYVSISITVLLTSQSLLYAQTVVPQLWVTNGAVHAIARDGNTIYIGGRFTNVGPEIAYGVPVHKNSGVPDRDFVRPNGGVDVALADGSGGWYIGGTFTAVDGQERKLLARINADGTLHPWNPDIDGFYVNQMLIANGRLYVAGSFGIVSGAEIRFHLVAFDLATGELSSWNPDMSGAAYVEGIALKGNTLYVVGGFTSLAGASRHDIGAIDITTGLATDWNPPTTGYTYYRTIAIHGNSVIIGGQFYELAGQPRSNLGAIDAVTGQATSWDPNVDVDGEVFTLAIDGHTLYVGGRFSLVNDRTRHNLASFNLDNLTLDNWKPEINRGVHKIDLNDEKIFIMGDFTSVNGAPRAGVAAFYSRSGKLSPWHIPVNGRVACISSGNKDLYIGGYFTSIGGERRNNIAALDANTGRLLPWNPGANEEVTSLLVDNKKLFAGGSFDSIGGQGRASLASFDLKSGRLSSWNPAATGGPGGINARGNVKRMVMHSNTLYFIGSFRKVGGVPRGYFAAVDATSGALSPFYPLTQITEMEDLALANGRLYIAGVFNEMAGEPRKGLASFDLNTGQLTPWSPIVETGFGGLGSAMTVWNNTVYIGGSFYAVNGEPRVSLAAVDGITGALTDWTPPDLFLTGVYRMATDGINVYVGIASEESSLLMFDAETGQMSEFNPKILDANSTGDVGIVYAILPSGNRLYVGGEFTSVYDRPRPNFVGFDLSLPAAKLLSFETRISGYSNSLYVRCNWSIVHDRAVSHFVIERSAEDKNFVPIGKINASHHWQSRHRYEFKDANPLQGVSYYRLRMVNKDNSEKLSYPNKIDLTNETAVRVYPVPADKELTIVFKQIPGSVVDIVLLNQNGRPVWERRNTQLTKGAGIISIPVGSLLSGYYLLRITSGKTIMTKAVIVQH